PFAEAEHHPGPLDRGGLAPGRKRLGGRARRPVDLGGGAVGDVRLHAAGRRVENLADAVGRRGFEAAVDQDGNLDCGRHGLPPLTLRADVADPCCEGNITHTLIPVTCWSASWPESFAAV